MTSERFIVRARRLEARCRPYRWTWAQDNQAFIAENWRRLRADKPRLFDGRILLVSAHGVLGETLRADFFEAGYSEFLGWREAGFPATPVVNGFAMGALQSADGVFVMGVMGAHTANAGRVYFAAGTPDRSDVLADGTVDLAASVTREIEEETGLRPAPGDVHDEWIVVREGPKLAFLRPIRMPIEAERLAARIRAHLECDPDPELAGVRLVRGPADIDEAEMPDFLKSFLRWSFATSDQG